MGKKDNSLQDELMEKYNYIPEVTKMLDFKKEYFQKGNFELIDLYSIMLWKLNRFPTKDGNPLEKDTLDIIKYLAKVTDITKEVEDKITQLLKIKQFELPMLSTILSFVNPDVFQIIDKRTNRMVMGESNEYRKNYSNTPAAYYSKYLHKLRTFTKIDFNIAGRAFYQLDIKLKNKLNDVPDKNKIKDIQEKYK